MKLPADVIGETLGPFVLVLFSCGVVAVAGGIPELLMQSHLTNEDGIYTPSSSCRHLRKAGLAAV